MRIKPAQYLLRFDDLCPTTAGARWQRFMPLIQEFDIKPILAVIPDNCDPALVVEEADREFWQQMRAMEAAGAAIGLHGYRHLCISKGRSLVALQSRSEFAGVAEETQRLWIGAGLDILRGHGLNPRLWVAPRHGFDRATLRALREEGIGVLSDGLAQVPHTRAGLTWIPQHLWAPVEKASGLWTICLHAHSAPDAVVSQLRQFLIHYAGQFTSVDRVLAEFPPAPLGLSERLYESWALGRIRVSRARARLLHSK